MERTLSELVAVVRRAGIRVSTAESLDMIRAALVIGLEARADLKLALGSVLAKDAADRARFDQVFEAFFAAQGRTHADLYERLRGAGFSAAEVDTLRALIDATAQAHSGGGVLGAIAQGSLAVDRLLELAGHNIGLRGLDDAARTGFLTMRMLEAAKVPRAETELGVIRSALRDALGVRGDALADVLTEELALLRSRARKHVSERIGAKLPEGDLAQVPFVALAPDEVEQIERAVYELAERLIGGALVRARHARRGRIDGRRTMRRALRTGGVPFVPCFRGKRRRRTKLVVLCDVSESVRASARFMLLFVHAVQRVFEDARSFVFVSDLREATEVFRRERPERAIELAYRGAIVSVADNSHYGRVWKLMLANYAELLDAHTTLLIIGDGRTNHFDPGHSAFQALSERVDRVLWLSPEPAGAWGSGDSALAGYARHADQVLPVYDLASLRTAARAIARF